MYCVFNSVSLIISQHIKTQSFALGLQRTNFNFALINLKEVALLFILTYFHVLSDLLGSAELFLFKIEGSWFHFQCQTFQSWLLV